MVQSTSSGTSFQCSSPRDYKKLSTYSSDAIRYGYEHSILPFDDPSSIWDGERLEPGHRISIMIRVSIPRVMPFKTLTMDGRTCRPNLISE